MAKPKIRFKGYEDDWEQRKLEEYVSITSGEAPSKFEEGTELYVKVDDLNYNDKYVVDTQNKVAEHSTVKRVTKGSVVFPKRGAAIMTNKVRILGIDSYMDTNMMALTSERLDSEFLYNIISKEGLYKIADTSTIPQINNKHIEPYEVKIPSLDEQRRIGVYFKQLDHLITLHQQKCNETKKLKKYMLQKMFPEMGEKTPKIRFKGFTDDWEQRKLGEIASSFEYGLNAAAKEYDGENKYIRITDIDDNTHEFLTDSLTSPDMDLAGAENYKLEKGDILFARTGASVGKSYIYRAYDGLVYYAGFLIRARIKDEYDSEFVFQNTLTDKYNKYIAVTSQRSGQPGVNAQEYSEFEIQVSQKKEQTKIGDYFKGLDHLITLHQQKCEELQKIKKFMLQNMFV